MLVVKVGGSLFDWPNLGPRLRAYLASLDGPVLLVPGGGPTADVVRALDRYHALGPAEAHWLAVRACALNAWFLRALVPGSEIASEPLLAPSPGILDMHAFLQADEGRAGCLPHDWTVTSDGIAARVAEVLGAELVLLKSVSIEASDWQRAARDGQVDEVFPAIVARAGLRARAINFRLWPG